MMRRSLRLVTMALTLAAGCAPASPREPERDGSQGGDPALAGGGDVGPQAGAAGVSGAGGAAGGGHAAGGAQAGGGTGGGATGGAAGASTGGTPGGVGGSQDDGGQGGERPPGPVTTRDARAWPFSAQSIWNMPIGSDARYLHAGIKPQTAKGTVSYHNIIIITPEAPLMDVLRSPGGWGEGRCDKGSLLGKLPIPANFYVPFTGKTVDHPVAVLEADGRTFNQSQPFHRCPGNAYANSKHWGYPNVDIYGDGTHGAHGGSGLSSVGGTIRVGEFTAGIIRHAVKISMYARMYYHYDKQDPTPGYRWPAVKADGYADGEYAGTNKSFEMGALLALKPDFEVNRCQTKPGKILAKTFKDYGGYIVDDSKWNVFKIPTEHGPAGSVDDEFAALYGHPFEISSLEHPWPSDVKLIFTNLHIIDNNGPGNVGGGGRPRAPLAPAFAK